MHLYLYDFNGKMIRQVEQGDYDVTDVYGFDERTGNIFYQSASPTPMNREVYQVDQNGNQSLLTPRKGWNSAVFSGDYAYFVNTWSDRQTPYVYTVCNQSGKRLRTIIDNQEIKEKILSADIPQKDFFQFTTGEGHTLNGWMMKPVDFDSHRKYPVIMFQYGGPGNQQVIDSWNIGSMGNGGLYDAYLTQRGFIVVCVDGRGTGGRGTAFEKCTYLRLGDLESKDQVETALWLGRQPYVDADRIGIWGWSFGGFNTLMSMSEGRPVFRAGVAVAPPTNWKYYDSIYSERYMRTPQENPDGYAVNPIQRADQLHGALLICHGTADDNVHPQNTYEYVEALVQADKDFKENLYTNRNHSIYGGNTRTHLLRQIAQFFEQELKP
jgi:dipeptidyl-peptidase-4